MSSSVRRFAVALAVVVSWEAAGVRSAPAQWVDAVRHNVTNAFGHGAHAIPYDFDRDGDRDLISSYTFADAVYLALNTDGTGLNWQLVQVAANTVAPNALPFDADCDGDRDIVAIGFFDRSTGFDTPGKVSWFARPTDLTVSPWVENVIDDTTLVHVLGLDVGDIDGDTDQDILVSTASNNSLNQIVWFENRCAAASGPRWQRWTVAIDPAFISTGSIRLTDIDGDARPDVLAADKRGSRVTWFANEGNPRRNNWTGRAVIDDLANYAGPDAARPYDMDGDGDQDVVVAFADSGRLDWFEHPANPLTQAWTAHAIAADFPLAHDLVRDDFDNDRLPDIAAVSQQTDSLAIFQNNGDGTYTRRMPEGNYFGANYVDAADIDGDGDADITSGSYGGDSIDWWENGHGVSATANPREASPAGTMTASKGPGSTIAVSYAPAACATNHAIYWGRGPLAPGADWSGVACGRGATDATTFDPGTPPPGQLIYFVVVGQNATQEGSYGRTSAGAQRPTAVHYGPCDRCEIVTGVCP